MASAYELAVLSQYVYDSSGNQQTRIFNIDPSYETYASNLIHGRGGIKKRYTNKDWAIIADNGISNNFYASKFQNLGTGEFVIAFRGTGFSQSRIHTKGILDTIVQRVERTVSDLAVDGQHLLTRSSPYVIAAAKYINENKEKNMVITGHSLGGFLAYSMSFFHPSRIVAFNPPHVINKPLEKLMELVSQSYKNSKFHIFESSDDFVTMLTRLFKSMPKNIKYHHGMTGGHGIDTVIKYLRTAQLGSPPINWNF